MNPVEIICSVNELKTNHLYFFTPQSIALSDDKKIAISRSRFKVPLKQILSS
jgi:hypothetical protein